MSRVINQLFLGSGHIAASGKLCEISPVGSGELGEGQNSSAFCKHASELFLYGINV
jgi:hypothetical protein